MIHQITRSFLQDAKHDPHQHQKSGCEVLASQTRDTSSPSSSSSDSQFFHDDPETAAEDAALSSIEATCCACILEYMNSTELLADAFEMFHPVHGSVPWVRSFSSWPTALA